MLDEEQQLEALLKKDEDKRTKKERDRFKDIDGLREDLRAVNKRVDNAYAQLSALWQQEAAYVQLLTRSHTRKSQLENQLDALPAISRWN